jgi:hypothetical protein
MAATSIKLRIPMNTKMKLTVEIMSAGSIALAVCPGVAEADCTPVVYVFRHAEDYKPTSGPPWGQLTNTGAKHASLYPGMINVLMSEKSHCPVKAVYATNPSKNETPGVNQALNLGGSDNSFCTARPLARGVNSGSKFPSPDPKTNKLFSEMCNMAYAPSDQSNALSENDPYVYVSSVDGKTLYGLDEYMGNTPIGNFTPSYTTDVAAALRRALLKTANEEGGSSAIYWTSQGLHMLGGAILGMASVIPQKDLKNNITITDAVNNGTPPRNAVYVFEPKEGQAAPNINGFQDTSDNRVQCYNHVEPGYPLLASGTNSVFDPAASSMTPDGQKYYCGYGDQSNLGGKIDDACTTGSSILTSGNSKCTTIPDDGGQTCVAPTPNSTSPFVGCNQYVQGKICKVKGKDSSGNSIQLPGQGKDIFGYCS